VAEMTPIVRTDTAKLHFTRFFTRANPPQDAHRVRKFVEA
jgi:hypothetical protein